MAGKNRKYQSFHEFWPYYVSEHRNKTSRWLHFVGTLSLLPLFLLTFLLSWKYVFIIPVVGYGFAWAGHLFFEKNTPATFQYPLWSLLSDFKMFAFILVGQMEKELARCQHVLDKAQ